MLIGVRLVGRESRRLCVVNAEGRGGLADGFAWGAGRFIRRERFTAAGSCYRMLLERRERMRRRPNRTEHDKRRQDLEHSLHEVLESPPDCKFRTRPALYLQ